MLSTEIILQYIEKTPQNVSGLLKNMLCFLYSDVK
jgi:hypothetical protein